MEFLKQIAGSASLPAGGAAAAYTCGLAIGLVNKIILIGIHRHADSPEIEKTLLTAKKELERLLKDVEELIDEDVAKFKQFVQSRRSGDSLRMESGADGIIDVNLKVMEKSGSTFDWIIQLYPLTPRPMMTHLLVACELLSGAINATTHVARDNIQALKAVKKRNNYLKRVDDLKRGYHENYIEIMALLSSESEA